MVKLIALMVVITALMAGALGAWIAIQFKKSLDEQRLIDLERMIHEVSLAASEQNRITREQVNRNDEREINHWNFINDRMKLW